MMEKFARKQRNILRENVIHVGKGFVAKERPLVVETLSTLGPHLGKWDARDVNVDVSLLDRGGKEQRVILRTSLPGLPSLVAVAENPDITRALCDAKRELIRQIEHQKSAREPMKNRRLSTTIRHPDPSARPGPPIAQRRREFRSPTNSSPPRADSETDMTHITEARVIGNHAEMGGPSLAAARIPLTARDILRAGVRRRARREEMVAAHSAWDSEGGATGKGESLPKGREGRAPRGLGR